MGKLRAFGAEVTEQDFTATAYNGVQLNGTNIIGRYNPEMQDRLLLAAHWDTRHVADSPLEDDPAAVVNGADDGASGVGVLLEIARQLHWHRRTSGWISYTLTPKITEKAARITLTAGGLGAQYYSSNLPPRSHATVFCWIW